MIRLGITQEMYIIRETSAGAYLAQSPTEKDEVVLQKKTIAIMMRKFTAHLLTSDSK